MFGIGINAFAATLDFDSVLIKWAHPSEVAVELRYRILDADHGNLAECLRQFQGPASEQRPKRIA